MNMEERIVLHSHHGFQCKSEALDRFLAHYWKIHRKPVSVEMQEAFEMAYMQAWQESRQNWTLHNGEPK